MYLNTNNPLLVKDDVGKGKPQVRDLPSDKFVYGYKPKAAPEGVKESSLISPAHPDHAPPLLDQEPAQGLRADQPPRAQPGPPLSQGLCQVLAVAARTAAGGRGH